MDHRILIAAAVSLVLVAVGGFYFALSKRLHEPAAPPVRQASAPPQTAPGAPASPVAPATPVAPAASGAPATPDRAAQDTASQPAPAATPKPAGPVTATDIEAEIAASEHAELQALLKKYFVKEYTELIAVAVRRRNEGVSDEAFGQELFTRFQEIMRSKLRYAVAAGMPLIDKLAANETVLFHALSGNGAAFCLRVLGKESKPSTDPLPAEIRRLMRLGTLYRFQAIVDGMQRYMAVEPLTLAEIKEFDASLLRDGLSFDEVRSGAFLNKAGEEPGKPCVMVEKLYQAIARLGELPRRKLFAGVFFLGRDN
jgi:hypothetical protein